MVGVTNLITIKPRPNAAAISEGITQALHRSWFDPNTIRVSAEGGKVRLSGSVHSPYERRMAANTAWAAPGATSVENDLAII